MAFFLRMRLLAWPFGLAILASKCSSQQVSTGVTISSWVYERTLEFYFASLYFYTQVRERYILSPISGILAFIGINERKLVTLGFQLMNFI
jgi:hypothetical protein